MSKIGNTSLDVKVDIYIEQMYEEGSEKAISGSFTFVALDKKKNQLGFLKAIFKTKIQLFLTGF